MADALPPFDAVALIAQVRRGEEGALKQAYHITFGGDLGRLVLAHHLQQCGVGRPLGDKSLKYSAGMIDAALDLASKAGFDGATIAVGVLTDTLEENRDEPSGEFSNPGLVADENDLEFH